MASERISVLDAIKGGDIQASLLTTFNANLRFYEDLILRRLTAAGSRNNVLVMDERQCALALESAATRPNLAGVGYTLVPVSVSGAFHPKICLLAGKQRASLFIGSHNLTISGFGYNREVSSLQRLSGVRGSPERKAFEHAWSTIRGWLQRSDLPQPLLESAYKLDRVFGLQSEPPEGDTTLLAQHAGSTGLLDQLAAIAPAQVTRVAMIGAFFDAEGQFVSDLLKRWPAAKIVLGVEPATVCLSNLPASENLKVVDASNLGRADGYLHAKAVYLQGALGDSLFACGSANPSAPAWLTTGTRANTEAMLVSRGSTAKSGAAEIGLDRLASLPTLSKETLREIMSRTRLELQDPQTDATPVLMGIANHLEATILLSASSLPAYDRLIACGDGGHPLPVSLGTASSGVLSVSGDLLQVRTLIAFKDDVPVVRVLVHHPQVIDRLVNRAGQESTTALLRALGSDMEDISHVLPALERVIFAGDIRSALRAPGQRKEVEGSDGEANRPDTLRVPLAEVGKASKQSLFAESHDLAYLIEILTRHIDVGTESTARGMDRAGRSEEEQIGQDDEEDSTAPREDHRPSDADISTFVCRRAGRLCRRMKKALIEAPRTQEAVTILVVQMLAVLALLNELSKLEQMDRWRIPHLDLFRGEDLDDLLEVALERLFVSEAGVHSLCNEGMPDEVSQLAALMIWASWLLDYEWWSPTRFRLDTGEQEERACLNARLLHLLMLAGNDDIWSDAQSRIERAMRPDPLTLRNTMRWIERHKAVSDALLVIASSPAKSAQEEIATGDIVDVPGVIDRLLVATATYANAVEVGCRDGARKFATRSVRRLGRV